MKEAISKYTALEVLHVIGPRRKEKGERCPDLREVPGLCKLVGKGFWGRQALEACLGVLSGRGRHRDWGISCF